MGMIEEFGEQFLAPMKGAVADALAVAEENQRRLRYAYEALEGNYPGANGHIGANGHVAPPTWRLDAAEMPALIAAPAPPELEFEMDVDRVHPRVVSLKDLVEQVLKAGARFHFIGLAGTPGAMKASEVLEVMLRWGWRGKSVNPASLVATTITNLWKEGKVERVGTGNYLHAKARRRQVRGDNGSPVDVNSISIIELVRLILVQAEGNPLSPAQIVEIADEAGWSNRTVHRVGTVRSMACRLMEKGTAQRVGTGRSGRYAIARSVARQQEEAEEIAEAAAATQQ